jgi:tRNA A-37 threonylcarbamoyl transferase component Bud32
MNDKEKIAEQSALLDKLVADFEEAWSNSPPSFLDYIDDLNLSASAVCKLAACELAVVDMELRWSRSIPPEMPPGQTIDRPLLRHYCELTTKLPRPQDWSPEFIAEEYRIRKRFEDNPSIESYLNDFPNQRNQLAGLLPHIDQQLAADRDDQYQHPAVLPATVADPRAPLTASDYTIQQHIATGGSSRVYRAWQNSLQRHVAVKVLRKKFQTDGRAIEQLLNEARALASLRHPHIVAVHGMGRFPNGVYFLAMDYVRGQDLQSMRDGREFSLEMISRLATQLATAIGYAHQQGVVHRDLKPANILIDENGEPYITDFGLASTASSASPNSLTCDHQPAGTPKFMAPEQWEGGTLATKPTVDIYGFGKTIESLLSEQDQANRLREVIKKCTEVDPTQRYADCDNLLADLAKAS